MDLSQIFGSTHAVTWWQECTRTIMVFCYGLAVVRRAGRREFGKWVSPGFHRIDYRWIEPEPGAT